MKEGVYQADLTSVNLWQGAWGDRLLCYVPMALWQNMMMAWLAAFGESAFVVADGFDVDALDAGRERLPAWDVINVAVMSSHLTQLILLSMLLGKSKFLPVL
jgi:hypothetical protein